MNVPGWPGMMRRPTPLEVAEWWWRQSLAGLRPPTHEGEPQVGFYRTRLVRLGPWVPGRVWLVQEIDQETGELLADERLAAEVDGERRSPARAWISLASNPITAEAYDKLCRARERDPRLRASMVRHDLTAVPQRP